MTSWAELRTVAVVGTERRALPTSTAATYLECVPAEQDPELGALRAAALLGTARRAGGPTRRSQLPERTSQDLTEEPFAPSEASQLLELMLAGNAGPGELNQSLLEQWFARCAEHGFVVPHRLLVRVLDHATSSAALRAAVTPTLGSRGHWLASQRDKWSWTAPSIVDAAMGATHDMDQILQQSADHRDAILAAARAEDPDAGRQLIAEACDQLDAISRARVLKLLGPELSAADEELLEAALDDRSKGVRSVAIDLLNELPTSARAGRLARHLEQLVTKTGTLRKTVSVAFPSPPDGESLRDLPPGGTAIIEQRWFDALIIGTPLVWWEDTLEMTPAKLVAGKLSHPAELLHAWRQAAIVQHNMTWLEALFDATRDPTLLPYAGKDAAMAAFRSADRDVTTNERVALLAGVAGPWDTDFSKHAIKWVRQSSEKDPGERLKMARVVLAERLAPDTQPDLEKWLGRIRGSEHPALERALRNLIQQVSFRTSIDKAFA